MSLEIGKAIYSILSSDTSVKSYVGDNIYPIIIPEKSTLPCIIYERNSDMEYTRDGIGISNSIINVTILAIEYSDCMDITKAVFNALNLYSGTIAGQQIIDMRLSGIDETFEIECYIQKLIFNCKSI